LGRIPYVDDPDDRWVRLAHAPELASFGAPELASFGAPELASFGALR
jgi:hypothetical protein